MALVDFYGFTLPLEWVIGIGTVFILLVSIIVLFLVFGRKKNVSPIVEDMAIVQPIDENDNLQPGQLIGGLERTETDLLVTMPDWKDEEGKPAFSPVPIERVVPFTFFDTSKALKRMWIVTDKGHLEAASASVIVKGTAKRYDPPMARRERAMRYLVNPPVRGGAEFIKSRFGITVIVGVVLSGIMTGLAVGAILWK